MEKVATEFKKACPYKFGHKDMVGGIMGISTYRGQGYNLTFLLQNKEMIGIKQRLVDVLIEHHPNIGYVISNNT